MDNDNEIDHFEYVKSGSTVGSGKLALSRPVACEPLNTAPASCSDWTDATTSSGHSSSSTVSIQTTATSSKSSTHINIPRHYFYYSSNSRLGLPSNLTNAHEFDAALADLGYQFPSLLASTLMCSGLSKQLQSSPVNMSPPPFMLRYTTSYLCSQLFDPCNAQTITDASEIVTGPRMCKNVCLTFHAELNSTISNSSLCESVNSTDSAYEKRNSFLQSVASLCSSLPTKNCFEGAWEDRMSCGYGFSVGGKAGAIEYCKDNPRDQCCVEFSHNPVSGLPKAGQGDENNSILHPGSTGFLILMTFLGTVTFITLLITAGVCFHRRTLANTYKRRRYRGGGGRRSYEYSKGKDPGRGLKDMTRNVYAASTVPTITTRSDVEESGIASGDRSLPSMPLPNQPRVWMQTMEGITGASGIGGSLRLQRSGRQPGALRRDLSLKDKEVSFANVPTVARTGSITATSSSNESYKGKKVSFSTDEAKKASRPLSEPLSPVSQNPVEEKKENNNVDNEGKEELSTVKSISRQMDKKRKHNSAPPLSVGSVILNSIGQAPITISFIPTPTSMSTEEKSLPDLPDSPKEKRTSRTGESLEVIVEEPIELPNSPSSTVRPPSEAMSSATVTGPASKPRLSILSEEEVLSPTIPANPLDKSLEEIFTGTLASMKSHKSGAGLPTKTFEANIVKSPITPTNDIDSIDPLDKLELDVKKFVDCFALADDSSPSSSPTSPRSLTSLNHRRPPEEISLPTGNTDKTLNELTSPISLQSSFFRDSTLLNQSDNGGSSGSEREGPTKSPPTSAVENRGGVSRTSSMGTLGTVLSPRRASMASRFSIRSSSMRSIDLMEHVELGWQLDEEMPQELYTAFVVDDFDPSEPDEVALVLGDVVQVHVEFDDQWAFGVNRRTKESGVFPLVVLAKF
ncbi:hypothetical protein HDU76_010575 [Blyttiomyces sp. JEL0837]|nr:hypothetical protein HDU76_010575 [Blyttiomyces sp. JEL0837]